MEAGRLKSLLRRINDVFSSGTADACSGRVFTWTLGATKRTIHAPVIGRYMGPFGKSFICIQTIERRKSRRICSSGSGSWLRWR